MEIPLDPRLHSALLHALPWVAEASVAELHPHLVKLAAPPGEGFQLEPAQLLAESMLHEAIVTHIVDVNASLSHGYFYLRQVRTCHRVPTLSQVFTCHHIPTLSSLSGWLTYHRIRSLQTLGKGTQHGKSAAPWGKSLSPLLEQTVQKTYGPATARLLLSVVRFSAGFPEAQQPQLAALPPEVEPLSRSVWEQAMQLAQRAPTDTWQERASSGSPSTRRVNDKFRKWLLEDVERWRELRDAVEGLLGKLFMRSLRLNSRPVDCPINRQVTLVCPFPFNRLVSSLAYG